MQWAWPPSLAAETSPWSVSHSNKAGRPVGPPLKTVNARPAASGCTGSHCAALRCSFPVRLLPLPAPAGCCHAKPYVPLGIRPQSAAGRRLRASPARARQTAGRPAAGCEPASRRAENPGKVTALRRGAMVNGRKNARRDSPCDPLGLLGGENTQGYVPNPMEWVDPLGLAYCPKLQAQLQALTDKAVLDIINNPKLVQELMSPGSYMQLAKNTELYGASFGKAVERRVARLIREDSELSRIVEHTGIMRGPNGRFISSPDFTTKSRGIFDVTTNAQRAEHIARYGTDKIDDVGYLLYDVVKGLAF